MLGAQRYRAAAASFLIPRATKCAEGVSREAGKVPHTVGVRFGVRFGMPPATLDARPVLEVDAFHTAPSPTPLAIPNIAFPGSAQAQLALPSG